MAWHNLPAWLLMALRSIAARARSISILSARSKAADLLFPMNAPL